MHLAFLTPEYPHERVAHAAGIGTSIKNLVVALSKNGIQVSVFVYGQREAAIFHEDAVKIHLLQAQKYPVLGWYFHRKYIQNYVNQYIVSDSISGVEAPDWTGITAFMKIKAPLVIRFHGSDTYFCHLENRKQKIKNYWFEKWAIQKAKAFIAPTSFAGMVSKKLFSIRKKEIKTIHYGLNVDAFVNHQPEQFENGLLLYIGTIIRKKGVFELPEIFNLVRKEYPEAQLVMIGADAPDIYSQSASTWDLVRQQFKNEDQNNVHYLGKIPYQEVQKYIQKAHVCVFPSYAETLGMVTLESMAMQKPVVNTSIGWAQELMVDGESGFLVHPQDHELFASRILSLLTNNQLCLTMGQKARNHVTQVFDSNTIALQNITFYKNILNT